MDQTEQPTLKRPGLILVAAALGAFLATFNETFFNVALVPIMNDLDVSAATAQWLVTVNMLVAAIFVPIAGFLYRSIPTRILYLIAVGSLIVGSAIGMFAPSFALLIVARAIQAIGAGMVPVVCMNMTLAVAPKNRIGTYIGIVSVMTTLGPSSSPLVAGVVLNFAGWHMLFTVYGVMAAACFVFGALVITPIAELTHPKMDIVSTVLICLGLLGLMYGISTAFSGDLAIAGGTFAVGLVAMIFFVRRQSRIENPLINLKPFKTRAFSVGVVCVLLALMTVFAMNVIMPTFMQDALGFESLASSITLFPAVACACIFGPIAGRCYDRWGIAKLAPGGMLLPLVFEIALVGLAITFGTEVPAIWLAVFYAPVVAGVQFVIGPGQSFALSNLSRQMNTHGVVILSTGFQIAGCLGTSLFMGVYSMGEANALAAGSADAAASLNGFMASCVVAIVVTAIGLGFCVAAARMERSGAALREADEALAGRSTSLLDTVMCRDVYCVNERDSLFEAVAAMARYKTNGLPIVNDDREYVGYIDSGDITRYLSGEKVESAAYYAMYMMYNDDSTFGDKMASLKEMNVMELSAPNTATSKYEDGIEGAVRILSHHGYRKVPIIKDGKMIGIVSRSDLMRHFWEEGMQLESQG